MKSLLRLGIVAFFALTQAATAQPARPSIDPHVPGAAAAKITPPQGGTGGSWYFAVSGDSRDCGNLIMPKIAASVKSLPAQTPASFYWHLGDFRQLQYPDCDMVLPTTGSCSKFPPAWGNFPLSYYLNNAWDDFIQNQVKPFGALPVFLGIGNHELYGHHTREQFRYKFQPWLTQDWIYNQQIADARSKPPFFAPDIGMTYFHFIKNGVDFIYLDNAGNTQFDAAQLLWFGQVLAAAMQDPTVNTIIVGMHAALPNSISSGHAMDDYCQGFCSGKHVYDALFNASIGPNKKNVYVLASHSHLFQENVYNTPQNQGQVLPGWIVGTAGASQYLTGEPVSPTDQFKDCWKTKICYGYLLVEVRPDGTINPQYKLVTADSPPRGHAGLSDYCFTKNGAVTKNKPPNLNCACGEIK